VSRQKKKKFAENLLRENILEPGKEQYDQIKGKWQSSYFNNTHPITLELGCGRGEYTVGLAQHFANNNFIGVDIKGDRIWAGSGVAMEQNLQNVAFLRTQIHFLSKFFEQNEVSEIWLTFPDPRPKDRDEKRRLTFPGFMEIYQQILHPEGWFRFKTDSTFLFDYTLQLITEKKIQVKDLSYTFDLYQSEMLDEHHGIQTKYEKKFSEMGEKIKYMKFKFDN
jgi:tRNA (guanine-N7-)-methyltransferase